MRLPLSFLIAPLLLASVVLAQTPSEQPVSIATLEHANDYQTSPTVASNGTGFLAVWNDSRSPVAGLYATRVDERGIPLDPTGIRIGGDGRSPQVVWSGSSYVVVWMEQRFDSVAAHYSIRVARVSAEGTVIETPRTILTDAIGYKRMAASNGSRIVIAYSRVTSTSPDVPSQIYLAVLDRDAQTIALDVPVPQAAANNFGATVTSNGSDFLVVWTSVAHAENSVQAASVDATGRVVGGATLAQALTPPDGPVVASDGHDFLVFLRILTSMADDLYAMRVSPSLTVLRAPHPVGAPGNVTVEQPRAVWNNSTYFLVWTDPFAHSLLSLHLDRDGTGVGPVSTVTTWQTGGLVGDPELASNGGGVLLVWNDSRFSHGPTSPSYDVLSKLTDQLILILNPDRLLSTAAPAQRKPSIAASNGLLLTAWTEESGVYAARVTPAGPLDGRGIKLDDSGALPHLVFDGANFLVAWASSPSGTVMTARIGRDGRVLGTESLSDTCANDLTLVNGGSASLLAWTTCGFPRVLKAVRIGSDGRAIDSLPLTVSPSNMLIGQLAAAWNGSEYLIAFEQLIEIPSPLQFPVYRTDLYAARVSAALTLLDAPPIPLAIGDSSQAPGNSHPAVASDGESFLVAWSSDGKVVAKHVTASGILAEPFPLFVGNGTSPEATWDGTRYAVAWRSGTNLVASHLADDAVIFAVTQLPEPGLALTATAPGHVTAVYTRVGTEPQYGNVERPFVRELPQLRVRAAMK